MATTDRIQDAQHEIGAGRHTLDAGGVLTLDPALPFLLVYREPPARVDAGTGRLIAGEASHLIAARGDAEAARGLVRRIARAGSVAHGAFCVLEVWAAPEAEGGTFTVHAPAGPAPEAAARLVRALTALCELRPGLDVRLETGDVRHPPDLPELFTVPESWRQEILVLGLEVPPIFRDSDSGAVYPRFVRRLQHGLSRALRQALYEFVRVQTTCGVTHPLALGSRKVTDTVWRVDRALCAIEHAFDPLLLVSPVNGESARARFDAAGRERNPDFHYRLLPLDPDLVKRRLYAIEMETIDDPALASLFQDKREELDTQLTMLAERETPRFRFSSQRLYGTVTDALHDAARTLLDEVPPPRGRAATTVDAHAFRDAAVAELDIYRAQHPSLATRVVVRPDITGLMVSAGDLLIGESLALDPARVPALLHHEVGTHVLTYVNGRAQPLEQLSLGLAGYDEFQEGLAVLAEYLVGGLNALRMRLLAARVVAARSVERGGEFVDTFRLLTREYAYSATGAWHIALRVHQSGGFTRDFIYLRGLIELLRLLERGAPLEPMYIGKIAQKYIPIIEELRHRRILRAPPLTPRFLADHAARDRLAAVRDGFTLTEMICPEPR